MTEQHYLSGFGNEFESEALSGALPVGQFSPQRPPYGLYAEKFSNTAFTAPRATNRRTWFYRIRPSVVQSPYRRYAQDAWKSAPQPIDQLSPNPLRWSPLPLASGDCDFVDSVKTVATNGELAQQSGMAAHVFCVGRAMTRRALLNADGELLLVPYSGTLTARTECGVLSVSPGEIVVIPRGMKFALDPQPTGEAVLGYMAENYGQHLQLPERGPVGSDSFANTRDFLSPVAAYDDSAESHELICKFHGQFFAAQLDHSPFDVVAWTGNAVPYKYDLRLFNALGSISYDHPDPSIFTVLTSPSNTTGVANLDFVIFPPRWLVADHTFRPPWFHRNAMSELMGLIYGRYDAKGSGFLPGGMSLHNAFVAHGPDTEVHQKASTQELLPHKLDDTMAFMFESRYAFIPTAWALESPALQTDYAACWQGLARHFNPDSR